MVFFSVSSFGQKELPQKVRAQETAQEMGKHPQGKVDPLNNPSSNPTQLKKIGGSTPPDYLEQRRKMRSKKDKAAGNYQGQMDNLYLQNREMNREDKNESQAGSGYDGRIPADYLEKRRKRLAQADKETSKYQGDSENNYLEKRRKMRAQKDKEIASHSGDIPVNYLEDQAKMRREKDKEHSKYSGDLPGNYLEKRRKMRAQKDRKIANFDGDILVKTLHKRDKRIRKKSKKIANYQGDIVVRRVKKGMHPSAAYRGGKIKNSYKAKERLRRKMLKRNSKWKKKNLPNYQKRDWEKPKYDKRESEIWY